MSFNGIDKVSQPFIQDLGVICEVLEHIVVAIHEFNGFVKGKLGVVEQ